MAERGWIEARFMVVDAHIERMDKASVVLSDTVNRVPTDLQTAISEVRNLMHERVDGLYREIDKQNAANANALDRIERTMTMQIEGIEKISVENRSRLTAAEAMKAGIGERRSALYAAIAATVSVIAVVVSVLLAVTR